MKLSMSSEISENKLSEINSTSDLFIALKESEAFKAKSIDEVISRFIFALKLTESSWGHKAIKSLEEYDSSHAVTEEFDESSQTDRFKFFQCLARICVRIMREEINVKYIIAYCCIRMEKVENPKNYTDIYSMLKRLIQNEELTVDNQGILIEAFVINECQSCVDLLQNYRVQKGVEKYIFDRETIKHGMILISNN